MNTWTAVLCCLSLALPQLALAQGVENKPPLTQKEKAERSKAVHTKMSICFSRAERNNLKQGSKEYHQFIGDCMTQGK